MLLNNMVLSRVLKPLSALVFASSMLVASYAQELSAPAEPAVLNARITPRTLAQMLTVRNLELAFGRGSLAVSVSLADAEASLYEPILFSNLKRSMTERQRTSEERTSNIFGPQDTVLNEQGSTTEAGIRQRIPLGGEVSLSGRHAERSNNILTKSSPSIPFEVNAGLVLSFKQPLLRGAGIAVTETDKRVAAIESQVAQWQYLQQLHKVLAENLSLFWQVDVASQIVRMREQLLTSTHTLVQDAQVRVDAGKLAPRTSLEIERIRLMREADLLRAVQTRDELKLRLLSSLDLDATQLSQLELEPQAGSNPDPQSPEAALAMWAPYQVAILRKSQGEIRLDFADNQRRSAVDLVVSYTHSALTNSKRRAAWDIVQSGEYPDWFIGLNIEVGAQGNRRADAQWLAQVRRVEQSETEIAAIRQVFLNDRQGKMMAQVQLERESALMLQEVKTRQILLDGENERFKAGVGLLSALLQSEQDWIESRIRLADAQGRLEIARVARLLADGNLLASYGIDATLPSSP